METSETSCVATCPSCSKEQEHEIVRKREGGSGIDVKVQCEVCSKVHKVHIRPNKSIKLNFLLSDGPTSMSATIEVDDDELFRVGDIFEHDEKVWRINTIESTQKKFMRKSIPERIGRITAKRYDEVRVKLTMTQDDFSTSCLIFC